MTLADLTEDEREDFEERAAIIQYDGGVSREKAERWALDLIARRVADLEAAVLRGRRKDDQRRR